MIEFTDSDYPPFLTGPYKFYNGVKESTSAVQSTFQELSDRGIRLSPHQTKRTLPASFLQRYGTRKIFVIIDWELNHFTPFNDFFIEVISREDAEKLGRALSKIASATVTVETLSSQLNEVTLEGFCGFCILRL